MKSIRFIPLVLIGLALSAEPALAQSRSVGGASRSTGVSHSSSPSRSSGSYSSPSRSSSSYTSPSRSSSSYTSPSRSSSSYTTPSHSSSSYTSPSRSSGYTPTRTSTPGPGGRTLSQPGTSRTSQPGSRPAATPSRTTSARPGQGAHSPSPAMHGPGKDGRSGGPAVGGRPSQGTEPLRAGQPAPAPRPGHMPPSARPMHPAFHHPIHHGHCHVHVCPWDACIYHHWHWPGFWMYCNTYWYDYHCTDVVVVRDYVQQTYNTRLITYAMCGDLMYVLVEGPDGETYFQVYDSEDRVLAEQRVSSKYIKMEIDRENGGCWILKKKDKDPMLFLYQDGKLLIYEAE